MKINILLFTLLIACLAACGGGNTPKGVAQDFYNAIKARNFEKAAKLATPQSVPFIEMLARMPVSEEKPTDHKIISVDRISDEAAIVTFEYFVQGTKKEEKLKMKKIDGRWLVDAQLAKK
jgi:hypothetical protein